MKVLVTGVGGQLGHDVMNELAKRGHEGLGTDILDREKIALPYAYRQLDITNRDAVDSTLRELSPDAVIHCAAWTAVDAAEEEANKAKVFSINVDGTRFMAKACKESVVLLMLRPGNIMPLAVRIPVSSKLIFQRYVTRLVGKMLPLSGVVTKITLDKTTNKSGQPYAIYDFEVVDILSSDEAAKAKAFGENFRSVIDSTMQ